MRARILLFAFLAGTSCCFGGVPDKIDGYIYYESGRTNARTTYSFAETHSTDGSYSGIYNSFSLGAGRPTQLSSPNSGTFTYRKLDETQAELILSNSSANGTRTLRFTSDTEGTVGGSAISSASFRLARPIDAPALVNCSNRSFIAEGNLAFTGFVITGNTARAVLVRAVGPGLAPFGITNFLRNPTVSVVRSSNTTTVASNDDWSSENADSIKRTSDTVGAFPLSAASKDAVVIMTLAPGAYVAQVSAVDPADTGQALIEVYILP
ncbi:MAG: hypothetical protein H7343_09525 [Undibacterium sp.]|nr:hypothetical protein [Opitutaceae bacterium]